MKISRLRLIAQGEHTLQHLGKIRDGLLVIGALLYGFGFVSWAIYAYLHNLGPIPGLDAQYFVAGIPILIIIIICGWISYIIGWLYTSLWFKIYNEGSIKFKITSNSFFLILFILCWILLSKAVTHKITSFSESSDLIILTALILIIFPILTHSIVELLLSHNERIKKKYSGLSDKYVIKEYIISQLAIKFFSSEQNRNIIVNRSIIIALALIASFFYIKEIYPKIPQTLGGANPRHAYIDIYKDKISTETLNILAENPDTSTIRKVIKSKPLHVYYESNANIIVVLDNNIDSSTDSLFDIKKDAIASIKWIKKE
jgi:hypothetical protein